MPHRVLYDDDRDLIKAISYHDPKWFPENATKNQLQFNVAVSDVTFGITSPKTGISKWSFITLLTPGHEAFVVVASAITHEDTAIFMNEMDVLLDLYPHLQYDNWVLIVDGDPAKFKAARLKFQKVRIILCLYHATENIKKHLGHLCLTSKADTSGDTPPAELSTVYYSLIQLYSTDVQLSKSRWIQCDDCSKWRRLCDDAVFPDAFICSSLGPTNAYNCCEADAEDGVPKCYEASEKDSNDEVILLRVTIE